MDCPDCVLLDDHCTIHHDSTTIEDAVRDTSTVRLFPRIESAGPRPRVSALLGQSRQPILHNLGRCHGLRDGVSDDMSTTSFPGLQALRPMVLDEAVFTEQLVRRLSLCQRVTISPQFARPGGGRKLPPAIETFFRANCIRIVKSAGLLSTIGENLHPVLASDTRNLELHVRLSFRPCYRQKQQFFEMKREHVLHFKTSLFKLIRQLPRLTDFTVVLECIFDLPPRPEDYHRFLRTCHYYSGATWEQNVQNSDFGEQMAAVIIPSLRSLAQLDRIAVRYYPGRDCIGGEAVGDEGLSDEAVALMVLKRPGRDIVLSGEKPL